jgi:hypothetical protein
MFQAQPSTFDTATEDQLAWDEFGYDAILATMDGALQQVDELATSQLTLPPPVLTQLSQFAAGKATTVGGATPAGGGVSLAGGEATPAGGGATPAGRATPDTAGSSQAAMATPSPDQSGPRVVRAPDPWRTTGTTPGLALELLGGRGADAFRCSTKILYKLFPCDYV